MAGWQVKAIASRSEILRLLTILDSATGSLPLPLWGKHDQELSHGFFCREGLGHVCAVVDGVVHIPVIYRTKTQLTQLI